MFAVDLLFNLVVIVVLALLIRTYIVSPFHVFGPSMCDNLNYVDGTCLDNYGEYIIVNEAVYQRVFGKSFGEPSVGDIIIFRPPENGEDYYVKRIVGVPGDRVKIENGLVYKWDDDEWMEFEESYLNEDSAGKTFIPRRDSQEYEVPEDRYFVLGDNRNRSTDSRNCFKVSFASNCDSDSDNTFVKSDDIRGKAALVFWPPKSIRLISNK